MASPNLMRLEAVGVEQRCPKCGLLNPPTAARCDCGWDFTAGQLEPAAASAESQMYAQYARRSWLFPAIAWASQIILALSLRGIRGLGPMWLLAMVVQFVLIVGGLYFGLKALSAGRTSLLPGQRRAAMLGVVLSGGTILLIVILSVSSSM